VRGGTRQDARIVDTIKCSIMTMHLILMRKKHFRPCRMAPSEWTPSIRAIRDIPVAAYSVPGTNTTRCVACHPPIAVSPFLLALSVCLLNKRSGVVANCDRTSERGHWVRAWIGIGMRWVMLRKPRLPFLLPDRTMHCTLA